MDRTDIVELLQYNTWATARILACTELARDRTDCGYAPDAHSLLGKRSTPST